MGIWNQLTRMSGQNCYTLTLDKPAKMHAYERRVSIKYPSGNELNIEREMIDEAWNTLVHKHVLTVDDAYEIAEHSGARTDRLMAVLRMLEGVTYEKRPRKLKYTG